MSSKFVEIRKICDWCEKEFIAKKQSTRYCSHTCNSRAYKANVRNKTKINIEQHTDEIIKNQPIADFKDREFLKCEQAAILMGVCRKTIYNLISTKKLKAVRVTNRITIIRRKDIDALLEVSMPYEAKQKLEALPITEFYTLDEILARYNIKTSWIWQIIKTNNIPTTKQGRKTYISQKHIDKYLKGKQKETINETISEIEYYTVAEAIERYKITREVVYNYCNYYKIERNRIGRYTKINKNQFDKIFVNHIPL